MWSILVSVLLVYFKLDYHTELNWVVAFSGFYVSIAIITYSCIAFFKSLEMSYPEIYNGIRLGLLTTGLFLVIFTSLMAAYLNQSKFKQTNIKLYQVMMPLFVALISSFGIFLFLLPGMYDPENGIEKRVPFLVMLYYISVTVTLVFIAVNSDFLLITPGSLLFGPLLFV
jgi:hypothetical protein